MNKKVPRVFLVILNWNRAKDTIQCLESINKLEVSKYELCIVVVDNASSDNSIELIKKFKVKIIKNNTNIGFAAGNNVGIKYALSHGADYVVILNNDTTLHPKSISILIDIFETTPNIGAASPKIYFSPGFEFHKENYKSEDLGKVIWYAGGIIDWKNVYGKTRGVDEVDKGQFDTTSETDFVTGTCMCISKDTLSKVGMFDESYYMYYEDTDLSIRIKNKGFGVYYVPEAKIWHKVAQSSGIGSNLNDYFISRNRLLFGLKYASIRTKLALIRQSIKLLFTGRSWERIGIRDYYLRKFGRGSWTES